MDHEAIATTFNSVVEEYVSWLKRVADHAATALELHALLGSLQKAATLLPEVEPETSLTEDFGDDDLPPRAAQCLSIDEYAAVFNPLGKVERTADIVSLANDLDEIYHDLMEGAIALSDGRPRDAICSWRFLYFNHWGRHLVQAQTAIWQHLSETGGH